jgi:hypothetical protein
MGLINTKKFLFFGSSSSKIMYKTDDQFTQIWLLNLFVEKTRIGLKLIGSPYFCSLTPHTCLVNCWAIGPFGGERTNSRQAQNRRPEIKYRVYL